MCYGFCEFEHTDGNLTMRIRDSGCLASCSSGVTHSSFAVGIFQAQLDTEQYSSIYAAADEKFHNATTEADFDKLLVAVHNKLGTVRESSLRNAGVAWFAGQRATVTLVYDTKFSDGTGREQFIWHIKDNQAERWVAAVI